MTHAVHILLYKPDSDSQIWKKCWNKLSFCEKLKRLFYVQNSENQKSKKRIADQADDETVFIPRD